MKQGQIITLQKNQYIVKSDDVKISCVIRGKIHKQQLLPRVGDFVLFDENKQVIEERTLEEVLLELRESKNYTYLDITEKLNQKGTYIEEKIIKKYIINENENRFHIDTSSDCAII